MNRLTAPLMIVTLLLAGCGGRFSDSGWNPLRWGGGGQQAATLEPEGGYVSVAAERPLIAQLTSARWESLNEGRLLIVTGVAPTKGYHTASLVTARPQPRGRLTADPDGVLRLRFVASPPYADDPDARRAANPAADTITVAMSISHVQLARFSRVEILSATNSIVLGR